jgi:hypothetical protein
MAARGTDSGKKNPARDKEYAFSGEIFLIFISFFTRNYRYFEL